MATTKMTVITLENLALYNSNIMSYIDAADAKSIKTVAIDGNVLKFYRVEEPVGETEPAYQIELPETDISNLLEKFSGATAGNVVTVAENGKDIADSGVKVADLALKSEVEAVDGKADANAEAINAINDETTGILAQAKAHADGKDEAIATAQSAAEAAQGAADKAQEDVDKLTERVAANEGKIGDTEALETTAKDDLVSAINEVRNAVQAGGTEAAITLDTTTTTDGALKSYTIKQGNNVVGTIDIPKDMVVESGTVVTNPEGQPEGTYIKLVLANVTEPLYINVGTLVDLYTAEQNATQVQLTIDSATRVISAVIVAGSIGTTELADNAITTVKIADGNVTKAKLSTAVQESLDKADKALDEAKAYTDEKNEAMDERMKTVEDILGDGDGSVADQIADAKQEAIDAAAEDATTKANAAEETAKKHATDLNDAMNARVEALEAIDHDHDNKDELDLIQTGDKAKWDAAAEKAHVHDNADELAKIADGDVAKWNAAEQNAKDYADSQIGTALEEAKTDASNKDAVVLAEAQKGIAAVQGALDAHTDDADIHVTAEDKTKWNDAAEKAHEHGNEDVLSGISAEKVAAWDSAEADAIAKAEELNTAMGTRVDGVAEDVADHEERLAAIEAVEYVEAENSEILALFNTTA